MTITIAKRKGTNATDIANAVLARVDEMKGVTLPSRRERHDHAQLWRDGEGEIGRTAEHLLLATLSVTILIALFLGWRESGVVLIAIPVTLAMTLVVSISRLHAQPRDAVRAHLQHRHPGRRRHRRRGEHGAALPHAGEPGPVR